MEDRAHFSGASRVWRLRPALLNVKRGNKLWAQTALPAVLLMVVCFAGCNNTCFIFTSNPPKGTVDIKVSGLSPTCRLAKANGTVRLMVQTAPMCSSCSESGAIQHIFVTIRSIEIHPSMAADDDSPDWEKLLPPEFLKQPLQVDLASGAANPDVQKLLAQSVKIPAGVYRQVRLRFTPNQPLTEGRFPEEQACGSTGLNCVVTADSRIHPILFGGGSPELRIMPDGIAGASLLILPDTRSDLIIDVKPAWAWYPSVHGGLRLLPALTGSVKVSRVGFGEPGTQEDETFHNSLSSLAHD